MAEGSERERGSAAADGASGANGMSGDGYGMRGRWQLPGAGRDRVPLMDSVLAMRE